jgi:hypothetical protein
MLLLFLLGFAEHVRAISKSFPERFTSTSFVAFASFAQKRPSASAVSISIHHSLAVAG